MTRSVALALALTLACSAAHAQEAPGLSVFVTDQNQDVFVALYGNAAVELSGCATVSEARSLLQLPADTAPAETTLGTLVGEFGFGTHARIPCSAAAFDTDWAATAPIWADVQASGNYYLQAPSGDGYVALPARCTAIKAALAIRERLQLPSVLQATAAPADLGVPRLVLDCGGATAEPGPVVAMDGATSWTLHRFETFLSEDSTGDTIYVARYQPGGDGTQPAYLPIVRADGQEARAVILAGGAPMLELESDLARLIGAPGDAPVTMLGAEAVAALRNALYADLCLRSCDGYQHRHAIFQRPGVDLGVTVLPPMLASMQMDRLGSERLVVDYAEGRQAVFTGCTNLAAALGLVAAVADDWFAATATALLSEPAPGTGFDCRSASASTCVRQVPEGGSLTLTLFAPGGDCADATRLKIELPGLVQVPQALHLQGVGFEAVELAPAPGVARSRLVVVPSRLPASTSSCVLSATDALIAASGLRELALTRVDLERKAGDATGDVLALQVQGGRLVLNDVGIGGESEGSAPVQRGVSLCLADLFAVQGRIAAEAIAIQGLSARVMVSGTPQARSSLSRARFGMLMSSGSLARLSQTDISAVTPVVLRGARLKADAVALSPAVAGAAVASAVQLERASEAQLTISTVTGFRCAASFVDTASQLSLILPGNDIARDNTHAACGPGQFSLIE